MTFWATTFGPGWGDELFAEMGGELRIPRLANRTDSILEENNFDRASFETDYGMNSTADYFATVFSLSIYRPESVPQKANNWLTTKLSYAVR